MSAPRLTFHQAIAERLSTLFPGARLVEVQPLGPDAGHGTAEKAIGYGRPVRLELVDAAGARRSLVFRMALPNDFGHDRRSDRAQQMLLDFDTFGLIPDHVRALDVGAVDPSGRLLSLASAGEFYALTTWAEGLLYAESLRRVAERGRCTDADLEHARALALYLARLHKHRLARPAGYRRAIRDLVGNGEGLFGIVDAYPADDLVAPPERLQALEARAQAWRWRLRGREGRLARVHGDFHPFNLVFSPQGHLSVLDASRGCEGDPADDVTALSINYLFFALEAKDAWPAGLGPLWRTFWQDYLDETRDAAVLEVAPPFFAWRALVLACPAFYPHLKPTTRDTLLTLAEGALTEERLNLEAMEGAVS